MYLSIFNFDLREETADLGKPDKKKSESMLFDSGKKSE